MTVSGRALVGGVAYTPVADLTLPAWRDPVAQPYTSTAFWNVPIGTGATLGDAAHPWVATMGTMTWNGTAGTLYGGLSASGAGSVNGAYYTTPVWRAHASDPLGTFVLADTTEQPGGRTITLPVPSGGVLAADWNSSSPDSFLALIEPDGDTVHEMYKVLPVTGKTRTWTARRYVTYSLRGTGSDGTNPVGGVVGIRASVASLLGGLIRRAELDSTAPARGRIPHALAMALRLTQQQRIGVGAPGYVWPARGRDYNAATVGNAQFYYGTVPLGARFAIPPTVDVTSLGLSDTGLALAWALQDYGALDVDSSSWPTLYAEVGSTPAQVAEATAAWKVLYPLLRPVLNVTPTSPGGPGAPRQPVAAPAAPA